MRADGVGLLGVSSTYLNVRLRRLLVAATVIITNLTFPKRHSVMGM